jgi:hypothetical protein
MKYLSGQVAPDDDAGGELSGHLVRTVGLVPRVAADAALAAILGLDLGGGNVMNFVKWFANFLVKKTKFLTHIIYLRSYTNAEKMIGFP